MNLDTTLFCVTGYHVYMTCFGLFAFGVFVLFTKYGRKMAGLKPATRSYMKSEIHE
jgi:hypothetical protein